MGKYLIPLDKIYIRDIQAQVHIGVGDAERSLAQDVRVSICMESSFEACSLSDSIADTIDYDLVTQYVIRVTKGWHGNLLERLASELAQLILTQFKIDSITVLIDKPGALIGRAAAAAVEVTRERVGESYV